MGKLFGGFFVLVIIMILAYLFVFKTIFNAIDDHTKALKDLVGEQVVIKGDTLEVVDYTSWNETVTLDDKSIISAEYATTKRVKSE